MPLFIPILLGAAALSAAGWGTKKALDGVSDFNAAKKIGADAQARYELHQRGVEIAKGQVNECAERYGRTKLLAASESMKSMVGLLEELQRLGKIRTVEVLASVKVSAIQLEEWRDLALNATNLLKSVTVGAVKGALSASGVYALGGSLGYASTGTAIGTLAGAAAKSATLAWLGGGSLATGGLGMAGGMVVLGGLVVAPMFLVGGFTLASQGAKALSEARDYEGEVSEAVAQMKTLIAFLGQVERQIQELDLLVWGVRKRLDPLLKDLWRDVAALVPETNPEDAERLAFAMQLTRALGDILQIPVLLEADGALNPGLPKVVTHYRKLLP